MHTIPLVTEAYQAATQRLLLLDYDGVLASIAERPEDAQPSTEVLEILKRLADDAGSSVVIISGRPHTTLEQWLGCLPVECVAEHGAWRRSVDGIWTQVHKSHEAKTAWKTAVRPFLEQVVVHHQDAFIEEKSSTLVLHYRQANSVTDETISLLVEAMTPTLAMHQMTYLSGKKVLEILPQGIDKGAAARFWLDQRDWPFVLAIGDDVTDEALFAAVGSGAFSIKVGDGATKAQYRLATQPEVITLLRQLARA